MGWKLARGVDACMVMAIVLLLKNCGWFACVGIFFGLIDGDWWCVCTYVWNVDAADSSNQTCMYDLVEEDACLSL